MLPEEDSLEFTPRRNNLIKLLGTDAFLLWCFFSAAMDKCVSVVVRAEPAPSQMCVDLPWISSAEALSVCGVIYTHTAPAG